MRIARDMHDEIGGKLSRISFLSDMASRGLPENSSSREQIEELPWRRATSFKSWMKSVWAVNPSNDTLESLVHYICRHAEEFFELTGMELEVETPGAFAPYQLSGGSPA